MSEEPIERLQTKADDYDHLLSIAKQLGYDAVLDALEATPPALKSEPPADVVEAMAEVRRNIEWAEKHYSGAVFSEVGWPDIREAISDLLDRLTALAAPQPQGEAVEGAFREGFRCAQAGYPSADSAWKHSALSSTPTEPEGMVEKLPLEERRRIVSEQLRVMDAAMKRRKDAALQGTTRDDQAEGVVVDAQRAVAIAQGARNAVLAERERCAKLAENGPPFAYVTCGAGGVKPDEPGSPYDRGVADERKRIAAAIRSQSDQEG